jgi:hypothetical protein
MLTRPLILCLLVASRLLAQDSIPERPIDAREAPPPRITVGVTTGTMSFADERIQQGVTGVVRYHIARPLALSISPTFARVAFPSALGGGSVSGLTDLPLELAADHGFDVPWTPTPGLSLGVSLPIGDKQAGFGTGGVGMSLGAGLGLSPTDALSLHLGFGKSLNDYSLYSTLGASAAAWGDLEASYQLLDRVEATLGVDGDLASRDTIGPSRAVAVSIATNLSGPYTLTVSGGHGVSGAAARWTLAVGFGTDFSGIQALGSSSPIQRFIRSLGGASHRGSGSVSSGHGRGP